MMNSEERRFYRYLSRQASAVASAAMTLASDCRSSDGVRVENPERVRALLDQAFANLKASFEGENSKP